MPNLIDNTNPVQTKIGIKYYELTNHLGNVLTKISDRKIEHSSGSTVEYYTADIISATDYYPFGFAMDERNYSPDDYKYGFNGKEKDSPGMGGGGSTYDYGFRIYNPSIARFLSLDPLFKSYPWYAPYQFAGNKPIVAIDLDGLEELIYYYIVKDGEAYLVNTQKLVKGTPPLGKDGSLTVFINHDDHTLVFHYSTQDGYTTYKLAMKKKSGLVRSFLRKLFGHEDKEDEKWFRGKGGWQPGGLTITTKEGGADPTRFRAENPADVIDGELLLAAIGGVDAGKFEKSDLDFAKGLSKVKDILSEVNSWPFEKPNFKVPKNSKFKIKHPSELKHNDTGWVKSYKGLELMYGDTNKSGLKASPSNHDYKVHNVKNKNGEDFTNTTKSQNM